MGEMPNLALEGSLTEPFHSRRGRAFVRGEGRSCSWRGPLLFVVSAALVRSERRSSVRGERRSSVRGELVEP